MFTKTIRKAVMKAIETKIEEMEQAHKIECDALDKECEDKKAKSFEGHVQAILSKII